jgi:hypothetical protein
MLILLLALGGTLPGGSDKHILGSLLAGFQLVAGAALFRYHRVAGRDVCSLRARRRPALAGGACRQHATAHATGHRRAGDSQQQDLERTPPARGLTGRPGQIVECLISHSAAAAGDRGLAVAGLASPAPDTHR